jgi:hypothetical protein
MGSGKVKKGGELSDVSGNAEVGEVARACHGDGCVSGWCRAGNPVGDGRFGRLEACWRCAAVSIGGAVGRSAFHLGEDPDPRSLNPRDPSALARYASAVSEPGSSLYRHFLTVAQFRARFAPTNQQIAAVEASLRSHGLAPGSVTPNGLLIPVAASAGRLASALGTSFAQVKLRSGRTAFANTRAPQFDASVAGLIHSVIGLDTLTQPHALSLDLPHVSGAHSRLAVAHATAATAGPQPCSAASSAAPGQDAYTANEIAGAYNFNSLYGAGDEGAGIRVALFELEPNEASDVAAYQSCYGTSATVTYFKEDGGAGSGYGQGEAALDIEDVIGLAPQAAVDVYQAPNSNTGLIDNYTAIVDNDTDKVVSTSWGECESSSGSTIISEEGTLFEQAATQGQTIYAAAGDDGSADCGQFAGSRRSGQPALRDRSGRPAHVDHELPADRVGVERLHYGHRRGRRRRLELAHDAELPVGRALVAERDQQQLVGIPVRRTVWQLLP